MPSFKDQGHFTGNENTWLWWHNLFFSRRARVHEKLFKNGRLKVSILFLKKFRLRYQAFPLQITNAR